jgi:hypothetical protein
MRNLSKYLSASTGKSLPSGTLLTLGILGNSKAQKQHNDAEDVAHVSRQAEYVHAHGAGNGSNKKPKTPLTSACCSLNIGGRLSPPAKHQRIDAVRWYYENQ